MATNGAARRGLTAVVCTGLALALVSCGSSTDDGAETTSSSPSSSSTTTAVVEGSDDVDDAEAGQGLATNRTPDIDYADQGAWGGVCTTGEAQSPIALTTPSESPDSPLADIEFAYAEDDGVVRDSGHSVEVEWEGDSTITLSDGDGDGAPDEYELLQFHFHASSEHTLDGTDAPLEVHFVHQKAGGSDKAVVGVLIDEGAENEAFTPLVAAIRDGGELTLDPNDLLPEDRAYLHYDGSLTTPACTEGVSWQVLTTRIELSADQIAAFTDVYSDNNRDLQEQGDRVVTAS